MKVGLIDSGWGGLSVLATLWNLCGSTEFCYLADLKNSPYGSKSKDEILSFSIQAVDALEKQGCTAFLFACNTATSSAVQYLRSNRNFPIFGMEPAIKPAVLENPKEKIAILATEFTLREEKFQNLIKQLPGDNTLVSISCEGLATSIDKGDLEASWKFLQARLNDFESDYKVVVLGCTHYVFLKSRFASDFPSIKVYDGNLGTSKNMIQSLSLPNSGKNRLQIFVTGEACEFPVSVSQFWEQFLPAPIVFLN